MLVRYSISTIVGKAIKIVYSYENLSKRCRHPHNISYPTRVGFFIILSNVYVIGGVDAL